MAWEANTERLAARLRPHIASGTILGVFIGDELTCCGKTRLPFSNLTALATKVFAVAFRGLCSGRIAVLKASADL